MARNSLSRTLSGKPAHNNHQRQHHAPLILVFSTFIVVMAMLYRIYPLITLVAFSTCIGRSHKYFTNCVSHKNITINKSFRTDGYYVTQDYGGIDVQIFYPDGTSLNAGHFANTRQAEEYMSRTDALFYRHLRLWGRYALYADTIKDQYFNQKEMFYDVGNETWYIATDSNLTSITNICKQCTGMPNVDKYGVVTDFKSQTWHFIPSPRIPSPTHSFINRKRWCRCRGNK